MANQPTLNIALNTWRYDVSRAEIYFNLNSTIGSLLINCDTQKASNAQSILKANKSITLRTIFDFNDTPIIIN